MTHDPKKPFLDGLDGLLGKLGEVLNEAAQRLDQTEHVQEFDTPKGPLRASSSLRVRVGGLAAKTGTTPKPVNPARKPAEPRAKEVTYDLFEDAEAWILTAELPGVAEADLSLIQTDGVLTLQTTGARLYHARIPMPCVTDQIGRSLHNGILTLTFAKGTA